MVVDRAVSALFSVLVLTLVPDIVLDVGVDTGAMFQAVEEISFINSHWTLFKLSIVLELEVLVEGSIVLVNLFSLFPAQDSLHLPSIHILALKCVTVARFFSVAVEGILVKTTFIFESFIDESTFLVLSSVIDKVSFVVWSVWKYDDGGTLCLALFEMRNNQRSVFLI